VDAVELMDIGFDKLREHLRPSQRAHRTITIGGIQPIHHPRPRPDLWFVRDANAPWAKENYDKLVNVGRGAALMTGTRWTSKSWPPPGRNSETG